MKQASQALKTNKNLVLGGITLLVAAIIGFYGFTQHVRVSTDDESQVHTIKPQVVEIQKQTMKPEIPLLSSENEHYMVKAGDSYHSISLMFKPKNVKIDDYVTLIKNINLNVDLHPSQKILIPNEKDLKGVMMPDVTLHFDYSDSAIIEHIKKSEGSKEFQASNRRKLLGGSIGFPFRNSKFYPYRDVKGNFTIGYGHYLGRTEASAFKYRNGISSQQAHKLLLKDLKENYKNFELLLQEKKATNLTREQQIVLFDMSFTMGVDKLSKFNRLWKSARNNNDLKFKKEIKDSLWYRQVGDRAQLLVSNL